MRHVGEVSSVRRGGSGMGVALASVGGAKAGISLARRSYGEFVTAIQEGCSTSFSYGMKDMMGKAAKACTMRYVYTMFTTEAIATLKKSFKLLNLLQLG